MKVTATDYGSYRLIQASSRISVDDHDDLETVLDAEISAGHYKLIIDMKNVAHFDSTGLGLLVTANNRLTEENQTLTLVNVSERVMNVFKLTRLDVFFNILYDLDELEAPS